MGLVVVPIDNYTWLNTNTGERFPFTKKEKENAKKREVEYRKDFIERLKPLKCLPEWKMRLRQHQKADKLRTKYEKLENEASQLNKRTNEVYNNNGEKWSCAKRRLVKREADLLYAKADQLYAEGERLQAESDLLWTKAIIKAYGNIEIKDLGKYECWFNKGMPR